MVVKPVSFLTNNFDVKERPRKYNSATGKFDKKANTGVVLAAKVDQSKASAAQKAQRSRIGEIGKKRAAECGIKKGISHSAFMDGLDCMKQFKNQGM